MGPPAQSQLAIEMDIKDYWQPPLTFVKVRVKSLFHFA